MHGQGDHHGLGNGETNQSLMLGGFLAFHGVNAAVPAFQALGTDGLNIVVDDLEIDLGVVAQLHALSLQLIQAALSSQTLLDLLPSTILIGADFTLAVLGAATLAVEQALGAVHDGANAAGHVQIALCAGVTSLLGQCHAVMAGVVDGVACCVHGQVRDLSDGLDTQAAGDDNHVFSSVGDQVIQLCDGLGLVAEEIHLGGAHDGLSLLGGDFNKRLAIRFIGGFKFFETLVASNDKQIILISQ